MTQNLATASGVLLSSSDSNINSAYMIPYGDLTDEGNLYTEGRVHEGTDSDGDATMWYNYCAVSAGTVCTTGGVTDASYDICSTGWSLPTLEQFDDITNYREVFAPVAGGMYIARVLEWSDYGRYWSATGSGDGSAYWYSLVYYGGSYKNFYTDNHGSRSAGFYARCVAK